MAQNILTGGRARFYLNGQRVGWAMGVTVSEDIVQEPAVVLDALVPAEHVVTGYTVQLQCQIYKVPQKDLVASGLWPQMGRTPDEHKAILVDFPEMTAEIWDSYLDIPVGKVYRVLPRTRNIAIQARGLVATNCTFVAIYFSDEGSADI